jgi:hypothetical protein
VRSVFFVIAWAAVAGCGGAGPGTDSSDATESKLAPTQNWKRDVVSTDLKIDLATRHGTAVIRLAESTRTGASFEVGGLEVESVRGPKGPLRFEVEGRSLHVGLPAKKPAEITVEYSFQTHAKLEGATQANNTFLWPYFCGNLFPCKSAPADGLRFQLELTGVPAGQTAVFPSVIPADAPSYMLAWAIGHYTHKALGTTAAGTKVSVYHLPGEESAATKGTAHLTAAFDWYERTYGSYTFGHDVASVSADWGSGAFGGMEHHPYWHVSKSSMADEETHAHEAAHGWFGDGVRIRCWEDLTLSEGTTSYVTARALAAVAGKSAGDAVWADYQKRLDAVVASQDRRAWPDSCGTIDVLTDLWNDVVYMKGAFFYRAVERQVGPAALDRALARFYAERRGQAAGMQDMLDTIEAETGFDAGELARVWLQSLGAPQP